MKILTSKPNNITAPKPKNDEYYDDIILVPETPIVDYGPIPLLYMADGKPLVRKIGYK